MKKTALYLLGYLYVALFTLVSCSGEREELGEKQEPVLVKVPIHIGQMPMETKNALPGTRSTMPMGPEQENPMRTLAVIQFDSEGNMLEINQDNLTDHPHYHFMDLTSPDNPSGVINASLDNVTLFSSENRTTRVCLIANERKEGIDSLLWNKQENRRLLWNEFRIRTIEIPYKLPEKGNDQDSLGHVREIYMYGHYEGELKRNESGSPEVGNGQQLSISLARVIARVEMNVKLGAGISIPKGYRIFFGMYNVEQSTYLVPGAAKFLSDSRKHNHITFAPVDRTEGLSETASTYYFYMAPHIVQDKRSNVTYFAVWCVPESDESGKVTGQRLQEDKINAETNGTQPRYPHVQILMCNDPLTEGDSPSAEGAFWLNRNSIYHVNLTLTYKDENTAATRSVTDGEYVINLKQLMKD